jgi:tRNA-2-methylthio-N6-dimethylallyladenosine synthase
MTKKVYIKTYGCQMNVYDSERMADILAPLGYCLTNDPNDADLAILNTCHIREKAEQKVYSDLGRLRDLRKDHPEGKREMLIAVGGCVAQAEGAEIIRQAPYVDLVFGPQTYHRLPEMIARAHRSMDAKSGKGRGIIDVDFPIESKFDTLPQPALGKAAAFLSVQEGCDKFCTFCVVPYTRGAEYSRPVRDVLVEARHLVQLGTKELTLLGQNVNAYHGKSPQGHGEWSLGRLIRELAEIPGLERIRYTTSHPNDMDDDLIAAHRDVPQLMPYLHLPIQSGSNTILEAMNRKHTRESYLKIIEKLRKARPDMALSSDFIVGFPGESEKDFQETLSIVHDVQYAQAYSFKYSIRPGTPAGVMELQVSEDEKSDRLHRLQETINHYQLTFNQHSVGKSMAILLEKSGRHPGQLVGRSPYMQSVTTYAPDRLIGQIVDVIIEQAHPNSIAGKVITDENILGTSLVA